MTSSIASSKSDLRAQIRERLKNISLAVRTVESMDLCARLEKWRQQIANAGNKTTR